MKTAKLFMQSIKELIIMATSITTELTSLKTDLDAAKVALNSVSGGVAGLKAKIAEQEAQITALQVQVTDLQGQLAGAIVMSQADKDLLAANVAGATEVRTQAEALVVGGPPPEGPPSGPPPE